MVATGSLHLSHFTHCSDAFHQCLFDICFRDYDNKSIQFNRPSLGTDMRDRFITPPMFQTVLLSLQKIRGRRIRLNLTPQISVTVRRCAFEKAVAR